EGDDRRRQYVDAYPRKRALLLGSVGFTGGAGGRRARGRDSVSSCRLRGVRAGGVAVTASTAKKCAWRKGNVSNLAHTRAAPSTTTTRVRRDSATSGRPPAHPGRHRATTPEAHESGRVRAAASCV